MQQSMICCTMAKCLQNAVEIISGKMIWFQGCAALPLLLAHAGGYKICFRLRRKRSKGEVAKMKSIDTLIQKSL